VKILSMVPLLMLLFQMDAPAQYAPANADWNRPVEAFRIVGNLYYVGASDVSAFLFTTPEGHILLDTGFRETVPLIEDGIRKLGFQFKDIRSWNPKVTKHGWKSPATHSITNSLKKRRISGPDK
jgi:hypothetical protein